MTTAAAVATTTISQENLARPISICLYLVLLHNDDDDDDENNNN